jgi:hypothetical protein
MKVKWRERVATIIVAFGLCVALAIVAFGIAGGIDATYDSLFGATMRERIRFAEQSESPDVTVLMRALRAPSRSISTAAANGLLRLRIAGALEAHAEAEVMDALFDALGNGPHWWWFGWEREEPEFRWFQYYAAMAIAYHGPSALPTATDWLDDARAVRREAACIVIGYMAALRTVEETQLTEADLVGRLRRLAEDDRNEMVRCECDSAYKSTQSAPAKVMVMVNNRSQEVFTVFVGENGIRLAPQEIGEIGAVHAGGKWVSLSSVVDESGMERLYPKGDIYARYSATHLDPQGVWTMGVTISDNPTW